MSKLRKKGFTLIELIAVLVIMAILALIVTPLVMNIIRKARIAADKRSIDAYGRSIELAIAGYLLDTGKFPTDVNQLSIEYSGDEVVCSTTQLNDDSSVYLTGCTVKGRAVDYAYGEDKTPQEPAAPTYDAYSVGDEVTYNNVDYYVIADSGTNESTVTLLKAEPLNEEEISAYKPLEAQSTTGYGYTGMQYHASSNVYNGSYIKTTVDAWREAKASAAIEARLITLEELTDIFGYEEEEPYYRATESTPSWVYNSNYQYWTMSLYRNGGVWLVSKDGLISFRNVDYYIPGCNSVVRPVIVLPKSALE